jgi:hypothetical protein
MDKRSLMKGDSAWWWGLEKDPPLSAMGLS